MTTLVGYQVGQPGGAPDLLHLNCNCLQQLRVGLWVPTPVRCRIRYDIDSKLIVVNRRLHSLTSEGGMGAQLVKWGFFANDRRDPNQWLTIFEWMVWFSPERWAYHVLKQSMTWLAMAVVAVITMQAQHGRWAPADDATAKFILDAERQWQEANCDHNKITEKILADDFWGTLPDGTGYGKAEEVKETEDPSKSGRECRISDTKVRLFGDNLAMVYGRAFLLRKLKDGRDGPRCLIYTDTWLKRNGEWQIVAAHDAQLPCSE